MFYIHQSSCISAQQAFSDSTIDSITSSTENKLYALDVNYDSIPPNVLRRLGKAVKMGIVTGHSLIIKNNVDGIVIGSANGGLEDCIKFLNQIIEFDEGRLTPTNFVQSTANSIAGQLGIMSTNKGYNITHVQRGLAFENALIDIEMLLQENPSQTYLVGGVDEISEYNYTIEGLAGAFKDEIISTFELLDSKTKGTIAGEGAAMFIVNNNSEGAVASVKGIKTIHTSDSTIVKAQLAIFLKEHLPTNESIDLLLSGKNGDVRLNAYYEMCVNELPQNTPITYYKHLTGDFATASAVALWLASTIVSNNSMNAILQIHTHQTPKNILLYNTYKGKQHSFILVSKT
jgi:hypothetical protein